MIRRAAVAAIVALAPLPAAAAVTIGTQIVDTRLTGTIAAQPLDSTGTDAATRPGTISAAAQLVERGAGVPAIRARSSVIAVLNSAERGRVTFQRTLTPGSADTGNAVLSSDANYRYFFTTDQETVFDVNWGVVAYGEGADGQMPGQALSLVVRGGGASVLQLGVLGDGASGSERALIGPGSYELRIGDAFGPIASPGGASGLSSQYSFTVRTVPEPGTWVLLLAGFGFVGVSLRLAKEKGGSLHSSSRT